MIAGEGPFQGDVARVIAGIAAETAPRLRSSVPQVPQQLDRLIAQTLEKDPARRPANLLAIRSALIPFSTRGSSIADLGRRAAAYFMDTIVTGFATSIVTMSIMLINTSTDAQAAGRGFAHLQFHNIHALVTFVIMIGYFTLAEGRYGCGFGKWMMGLRTVGAGGEAPGLTRSLFRALILPGLMVVCTHGLPLLFGLPFEDGVGHIRFSFL